MKKIHIESGKKFARLTVLKELNKNIKNKRYILCKCICGEIKTIQLCNLLSGHTKSCGCLSKELAKKRFTTHGMRKTKIYDIWAAMIRRCEYKKDKRYINYGGRGIKVCKRWKLFKNFYDDMGIRPHGMSLDRIDVNGNYEPSNCRWATAKEQANNKSNSVFIDIKGEKKTLSQWCDKYGISINTVNSRIKHGWSKEMAITKRPSKYLNSIRQVICHEK